MALKHRPRSFCLYARQLERKLKAKHIAPKDHDFNRGEVHTNVYGGMLRGIPQTADQFETVARKLAVPVSAITYRNNGDDLSIEDQAVELLVTEARRLADHFKTQLSDAPERKPVAYVYSLACQSPVQRKATRDQSLEAAREWNDGERTAVEKFFELAEHLHLPDWDSPNEKEPSDDGEQLSGGMERLISYVAEILSRSDATRMLILGRNGIAEELDGAALAKRICTDVKTRPMSYLARCAKRRVEEKHRQAICRDMCLLVDAFIPVSATFEELGPLNEYLAGHPGKARTTGPHSSPVSTRFPMIAASAVGYVKGLPVDTRDLGTFDDLDVDHLPDRAEMVRAVPFGPEGGRNGDIVSVFAAGLERLLAPYGSNGSRGAAGAHSTSSLGMVQSALELLAEDDDVHLCVLFPPAARPGDPELARLHAAFPELILLTSNVADEARTNNNVLNQVKKIREFFNADAPAS